MISYTHFRRLPFLMKFRYSKNVKISFLITLPFVYPAFVLLFIARNVFYRLFLFAVCRNLFNAEVNMNETCEKNVKFREKQRARSFVLGFAASSQRSLELHVKGIRGRKQTLNNFTSHWKFVADGSKS